ncbi:MAG: helix-turn-helix transcriptional regulator [Actinobacteria bacterium]|nr:helix-turn-helix transcriptional regulator [Actinomycetota bacterium]
MSRAEVRTRQDLADRAALDADHGSGYCAVFHRAIELIGRRWNGVIIRTLLAGGQRFSDVRAGVPGLSDRLLAERLRELEREGVVTRACPSSAGGARYSLTAKGQALAPVLDAVSSWAATWVEAGETTAGDGRDRARPGGIPGRVPGVGSSGRSSPI